MSVQVRPDLEGMTVTTLQMITLSKWKTKMNSHS